MSRTLCPDCGVACDGGCDAYQVEAVSEEPCPVCGGSMRFCEHMDDPFAAIPTEREAGK